MIRRYRFGNPLNTEAVVEEFSVEKGDIPRVEVKEGEKISFISATVPMIQTTGRIPALCMRPIIFWCLQRRSRLEFFWTIREKLLSISDIPGRIPQ